MTLFKGSQKRSASTKNVENHNNFWVESADRDPAEEAPLPSRGMLP